jgi:hypothetical protein
MLCGFTGMAAAAMHRNHAPEPTDKPVEVSPDVRDKSFVLLLIMLLLLGLLPCPTFAAESARPSRLLLQAQR